MHTINVKGKQSSKNKNLVRLEPICPVLLYAPLYGKNKNLVRLELVLYRSGYSRVSKIINIFGLYKDWDNNTQSFKSNSTESIDKNKMLLDLKAKYLKVAEQWEAEGRKWSPTQWLHCFDVVEDTKQETKAKSISQMIDYLIDDFSNRERFKNGKVISSSSNAREYGFLKSSLVEFTKHAYNKKFSSYYFEHINDKFLLDYALFLQKRGAENRNKGAVCHRLKKLQAVCNHASKLGMQGINTSVFKSVAQKMKHDKFVPKTVAHGIIRQIETIDRSGFTNKEQLHIDLFLFSFYAGGMANIDAAFLTWDCIKDDMICYERMKTAKEAKVLLIDKAKAIIAKYRDMCYENYVLPIFTQKHQTEKQKYGRVERLGGKVNKTLEKVCKKIRYKEKITWYSARGTFITKMINDGFHPVLVAEQAGNSPDMIYKHYYKTTDVDDIRKRMNSNF